eukprot:4386739-Pyramimonas_sp.AAC.3
MIKGRTVENAKCTGPPRGAVLKTCAAKWWRPSIHRSLTCMKRKRAAKRARKGRSAMLRSPDANNAI